MTPYYSEKRESKLPLILVLLGIAGAIIGPTLWLDKRFADLDTRMQKIESAIKTMNSLQSDDRQKELIRQLLAEREAETAYSHGKKYLEGPGVSADAPTVKKP